jgi:hypothetical protein
MDILELFWQCGILELFWQCGILELFWQCDILELFWQCGTLELNSSNVPHCQKSSKKSTTLSEQF